MSAAGEPDGARLRAVAAGNAVEQARLAGAIGSDDGGDAALRHAQRNRVEHREAAEAQAQVVYFE